jgi:hypothetical protein
MILFFIIIYYLKRKNYYYYWNVEIYQSSRSFKNENTFPFDEFLPFCLSLKEKKVVFLRVDFLRTDSLPPPVSSLNVFYLPSPVGAVGLPSPGAC